MIKLYPDWPDIEKMIPAPEPGELQVLHFLADVFRDDETLYEIYFQPNFSGICPDIVVLCHHHGVLVIEVKDWHLDAYAPHDDEAWAVVNAKPGTCVRSPFTQADAYKRNLYKYPLRLLTFHFVLDTKFYSVMQTGVFFTHASKQELAPFLPHNPTYKRYIESWTVETFSNPAAFRKSLGPYFTERVSKYFHDDIYEEMKRILSYSEDAALNQQPVTLNAKQQELVQKVKSYKVKGVAGSGKTELLAQKAVQRYEETGKPVLVLTFNITLRSYIEERIKRILREKGERFSANIFLIFHYHMYNSIYASKLQEKKNRTSKKKRRFGPVYERYATILVDEAQDFQEEWVNQLRQWLEPDGKIYFFGDEKQNIYGNEMQADRTPYTGIGGAWNTLPATSYRIKNRQLTDFGSDFQQAFLAKVYGYEEILYQGNLFDVDTMVSYTQFDTFDPEQVYQLFSQYRTDQDIKDCDTCFLSAEIYSLRQLRDVFVSHHFDVETTFETQAEYEQLVAAFAKIPKQEEPQTEFKEALRKLRRTYKFKFRRGSGMTKLSTIQSFKGWQIPAVFLLINNISTIDETDRDMKDDSSWNMDALLYTAITRAETYLYIIEFGKSKYTDFFKQSEHVSIFVPE